MTWPERAVAQSYSITDLGAVTGTYCTATSINDSGQVAGSAQNAAGVAHAFIYSGGVVTDIGALLGSGSSSNTAAISSNGRVVGFVEEPSGAADIYTYYNGAATNLGTLGFEGVILGGINASGQFCGGAIGGSFPGYGYAWYYSNGVVNAIDPNPNNFLNDGAKAINDSGQITGMTGTTTTPGLGEYAFIYKIGGTLQNIGAASGRPSFAYAINAAGDVAGEDYSTGQAFIYTGGAFHDIGGVVADGLNASDEAVGYTIAAGDVEHAFVYTPSAGLLDLNNLIPANSGWVLGNATAVNDNGWIVGNGKKPLGQTDAFLLIPVPEPSALAAGSAVLLGMLGRRARRRICAG